MIPLKCVILLLGTLPLIGSKDVDLIKCPQRQGLFPKPGSFCKAYYKCSNWIPKEEICPDYQLFNPVTSWCDWIYAFPCLDKPEREECPRDDGRFLKPGTECKVYYDCCDGQPTEKTCPPDTLFDPKKEKCEWSELYTCVEQPESKVCQKENGRFLKPGTDCKKYYDCRYGKPTERECPIDQLFDPSKGRCEWKELYTCIDKPIQEKCLKENGRFLKPGTHCKRYFDCRHGIPIERVCPDDELFDPSTESCEWSDLYTCVEDLSTNKPTVSTTTTVFETSIPTTSDDNQNYKTSIRTSTSSQPSTRSSIGVTESSTVYTSTGFSDHETTIEPLSSTTSSYTESDPDIRTSTHASTSGTSDYETTSQPHSSTTSSYTTSDPDIRSSTHASTSGTSNYESTSQPHSSTTSSYTESEPDIQSSTHASTSGTSDYESTSQPHSSTTSSYTTSDPDIRSSTSKLGSSSTHASTSGTSDYESTSQPHSSTTSSYTESDPDIRSSTGILGSSSTHASTSGNTDYESTRKPRTSTISYTSSDPNILSSTRGFRSSLPDDPDTTVDIFCPEPNGYFPHPTDKHKFVGCVNDVPAILTCPSNLVYIHKKRRCDYKRR